jgi:hypothetical protein
MTDRECGTIFRQGGMRMCAECEILMNRKVVYSEGIGRIRTIRGNIYFKNGFVVVTTVRGGEVLIDRKQVIAIKNAMGCDKNDCCLT